MLNPKGKYKGQKLNKLVRIKTPAKISKIIAMVPEITCVKYRMITMAAITNLIAMSMVPMFFFIRLLFVLRK